MRNKHRDMLEEIMSEAEKKKLQQQLLQVIIFLLFIKVYGIKGEKISVYIL
jgi:hypothetical protein